MTPARVAVLVLRAAPLVLVGWLGYLLLHGGPGVTRTVLQLSTDHLDEARLRLRSDSLRAAHPSVRFTP